MAVSASFGGFVPGPGHAGLVPRQILYVEDNPVNQMLMSEMVGRCTPHRLTLAGTVREGMRTAARQDFDLLLLDWRLPDGDGAELLAMLRRLPSYADVPAVAVTAEYGFEPGEHGFCEVWYKPLDLHQTLARLDRVLRQPGHPAQATQLSLNSRPRIPVARARGVATGNR
jgi:CheY-like chemotaxis protein